MNEKNIKNRFLNLLATGFIVLSVSACTSDIIPKAKMTNILLEMHLTDEVKGNNISAYSRIDSLSLYGTIFQKYGYTIDDFNNSIAYYANKPEMMRDMYSNIIKQLKGDYEKYTELSREERNSKNLWTGADSLVIETDSVYTKFKFTIPISQVGMYVFTANAHIFANDSTYNPKITAWFTIDDESDTIVNKQTVRLNKNRQQIYTLRLNLSDSTMTRIKGYFMDYDSIVPGSKQHAVIKDIYIDHMDRARRTEHLLDLENEPPI